VNELTPTGLDAPGGETPETASGGRLRVFISYRSDPDAPLASALKRLIEGAIDPQPTVFTAGDGGLKPSNIGFKKQLQTAAQAANAFVAIITAASKDREWISFEAGAAWGRDLMYAPVLVGARPDDMPSTIGDYQALNSQSKEDMLGLATSLAGLDGSTVKEHFVQRFHSFAQSVERYVHDAETTSATSEPYFGIKIDYPRPNEQVDATIDVSGAITKELPDGYTLRVVRIYSDDSLNPSNRAVVHIPTWVAPACNIGGKPGELRQLAVFLVGPAGAALFDYFADAARVHNLVRDELRNLTKQDVVPWLPNIKRQTPDMIECARVSVFRKVP
jgi:hypothetical protein